MMHQVKQVVGFPIPLPAVSDLHFAGCETSWHYRSVIYSELHLSHNAAGAQV